MKISIQGRIAFFELEPKDFRSTENTNIIIPRNQDKIIEEKILGVLREQGYDKTDNSAFIRSDSDTVLKIMITNIVNNRLKEFMNTTLGDTYAQR